MKLIIAIVQDEDSDNLVKILNKNDFKVTKISSTGGFLKSGNVTLLPGQAMIPVPITVKVGGATIFVIDVFDFKKF